MFFVCLLNDSWVFTYRQVKFICLFLANILTSLSTYFSLVFGKCVLLLVSFFSSTSSNFGNFFYFFSM